MNFQAIQDFSQRELEQFRAVCNQLLSRTFVVREIYRQEKGWMSNPDYVFLLKHGDAVRDYLALLDWDLRRDDYNGVFFVLNTDEANRLNLNKAQTAILLALRLIYDENQEALGLNRDAVCTVRDVLDKVVTEHAILSAAPNMEEVKRALTIFENHNLLQRREGRFNQMGCRFSILPSILTAVSSERLNAVAAVLRKEEENEEAEEAAAD